MPLRIMVEVGNRLLESVRGVATELADADLSDPVGLERRFHRFHRDDRSSECNAERLLLAAQDGDGHGCPRVIPQQGHHLG